MTGGLWGQALPTQIFFPSRSPNAGRIKRQNRPAPHMRAQGNDQGRRQHHRPGHDSQRRPVAACRILCPSPQVRADKAANEIERIDRRASHRQAFLRQKIAPEQQHIFPMSYYLPISVGTFTKSLGFAELAHTMFILALLVAPLLGLSMLMLRKQEN